MLKIDRQDIKALWMFLITIVLVIADQATKILIRNNLSLGEKIEVIEDFLYITHHTNPGAAWGAFGNHTMILIIMSIIISLVLVFYFFKMKQSFVRISFCIILGGAIGNLIDRIKFFEVTDFIDTYFWGYNFPIFNVADAAITVGTILLAIFILFIYKEEKKVHESE